MNKIFGWVTSDAIAKTNMTKPTALAGLDAKG